MSWPTVGYLSNTNRTVAEMQAVFEDWLACTKQVAGGPEGSSLQISGGRVAPSSAFHMIMAVTPPNGTLNGMDDTNVVAGHLCILRAYSGHTITVTHGTGGSNPFFLEGEESYALSGSKMLAVYYNGAAWYEVGRSWASDISGFASHIGAVSAHNTTLTGTTTADGITLTEANGGSGLLSTEQSPNTRLEIADNQITAKTGTGGRTGLNLAGDAVSGLRYNDGSGWHDVWHDGNDGASSGLDADFLDGRHGTAWTSHGMGYVCVQHREATGVAGGASVAGAQERKLNYIQADTTADGPVTLSSPGPPTFNYVVHLPQGTWIASIRVPAYLVGDHQARLSEYGGDPNLLNGSSARSCVAANDSSNQTDSNISGMFVAGSGGIDVYVDHYTTQAKTTNGLGYPLGWAYTIEIYTEAVFQRIAY